MEHKLKAVVVLSGGQDSTTCLYMALNNPHVGNIHAVTFDYGQRHDIEVLCARRIAQYAGVSHEVIHVRKVLSGTSPLVNPMSELEQYENHQSLPGGLEKTFVPMRNQFFLTLAANRAYVRGARVMYTGVSAEDYGGYPDCRPAFIEKFEEACNLGTFTGEEGALGNLRILTPLMYLSKAATVKAAMNLPGCYEALALSHTAYDGYYPPTGKDHASLLRAKGFEEANIPDPLWIRAFLEGHVDHYPSTDNYRLWDMRTYVDRVQSVMNWMQQGHY